MFPQQGDWIPRARFQNYGTQTSMTPVVVGVRRAIRQTTVRVERQFLSRNETDRRSDGLGQRSTNVQPHRKPGSRRCTWCHINAANIPIPREACVPRTPRPRGYLSAKFHLVPSLTRGGVPGNEQEGSGRRRKTESPVGERVQAREQGHGQVTNAERASTVRVRKFASSKVERQFESLGPERFRNERRYRRDSVRVSLSLSLSGALQTYSVGNRFFRVDSSWGRGNLETKEIPPEKCQELRKIYFSINVQQLCTFFIYKKYIFFAFFIIRIKLVWPSTGYTTYARTRRRLHQY